MATPVWTELVCRTCANQSEGQFTYGSVKRAELKKNARGWIFTDDECFCSQRCKDEYEQRTQTEA